jgi:hypothetical protein
MTNVPTAQFSQSVDEAIKRLISVEHFHAGSIVSMPVMYPSGAFVVLELSAQGGKVFVSDRGGGYQEAEYIGATRTYCREAERIASEAGIKFDGRDVFVAEVQIDRVEGAMAVVASCSSQAAALAAIRAADREEKVAKEALFDRLSDVFGHDGFEREVALLGASNHSWRVDARVRRGDSVAIFNSVTRQYVSAAGTAAKFYDLARLEIAPFRVAVVSSRNSMGDWYGVISAASDSVVEISAANDHFTRFRGAA